MSSPDGPDNSLVAIYEEAKNQNKRDFDIVKQLWSLIACFLRLLAFPVHLLIRRMLGERYVSPLAVLGTVILFVITTGLMRSVAGWFFCHAIVIAAVVQSVAIHRRNARNEIIHSRSAGVPWACRDEHTYVKAWVGEVAILAAVGLGMALMGDRFGYAVILMAIGVAFVELELRAKFRGLILDHRDSRIESERLQEAAQQKVTSPLASQGFIVQGVKNLPVSWDSSPTHATKPSPTRTQSKEKPLGKAG
ncbi:MAG: hypothetical protein AAF711_01135 [Planctomycetota bacterium]